MGRPSKKITRNQIQSLARFRYEIRRFLQFSEQAAMEAGLQPQQYQLLLQIAGAPNCIQVTISYLAEVMSLRHNSVVELSKRCELAGLLRRTQDINDRRWVLLELTEKGHLALEHLAEVHGRELRELAPTLIQALRRIDGSHPAIMKEGSIAV
jgi:DNA-binding MarR family transcriptional regulator